MPVDDDDDDL